MNKKQILKQKIKRLEEFIHSKEGQRWMRENKKRLKRAYKNKEGIFSLEEDKLWELYLEEE